MKQPANTPKWLGGTYWYTWRWPICVIDDFGDLVPLSQRDVSLELDYGL